MRLLNINGKLQKKSVTKYLVDWDKKSRSKIQFTVKQFLKTYWKGQVVYEEFPVYGTKMSVDILNATKKIAIEVQGRQHNEFNKFFHSDSRLKYLESIKRDLKKAEWLEMNDFNLIEINEDEINQLSKKFFLTKFDIVL
jgi:hypothetical protein|tara:strand:- start:349 stop:765 length:417 start_codon:yes stop_codon:yes gene_type:complete